MPEFIYTVIIPTALIGGLVALNMKRMKENIQEVKEKCSGGGCQGCSHKNTCNQIEK